MNRTAFARKLRRCETWAERLMWRWLRDRRFERYKFKRQVPRGEWFVDFLCEEAGLALELDGRQHGFPDQQRLDQLKEAYLESVGIRTLRFWNGELRKREWEIKEMIFRALDERAPKEPQRYWRNGVVGR